MIITESDHLWNDDQRVMVRVKKDDDERTGVDQKVNETKHAMGWMIQ